MGNTSCHRGGECSVFNLQFFWFACAVRSGLFFLENLSEIRHPLPSNHQTCECQRVSWGKWICEKKLLRFEQVFWKKMLEPLSRKKSFQWKKKENNQLSRQCHETRIKQSWEKSLIAIICSSKINLLLSYGKTPFFQLQACYFNPQNLCCTKLLLSWTS